MTMITESPHLQEGVGVDIAVNIIAGMVMMECSWVLAMNIPL